MQLPRALREAVAAALEGIPTSDLARANAALSQRYRGELRDGRLHVADDLAARAYLAARLPATFAATRAALGAASELQGDFTPRTLLDVGAGPGTALWAAADVWPSLDDALLVEASASMRAWGEQLCREAAVARVAWRAADAATAIVGQSRRDLVTVGYVLGEIDPASRLALVRALWTTTAHMLVIVEPGTPAGWQRVVEARAALIAEGAHIVAPCPHAAACPLSAPDWCHFVQRVERSRTHRATKVADVPWEDEKFIYVAAARKPAQAVQARVIAPPRLASGRVQLKLCKNDGSTADQLVTRREGEAFKVARRLDWGDAMRSSGDL